MGTRDSSTSTQTTPTTVGVENHQGSLSSHGSSATGSPQGNSFTQEQIVAFMLTEYATMQNLRQTTQSTGETRLNFFLASVSGALVGLALIFQVNGYDQLILVVASFIIVGLLLVGLAIYGRLVERSLGIIRYTRGMNRIRRYFIEQNPHLRNYITESISDAYPPFRAIGKFDRGSSFIGDPGVTAIFNSVIAGTSITAFANVILAWSILSGLLMGLLSFIVIFVAQRVYFLTRVNQLEKETEVRFPESK